LLKSIEELLPDFLKTKKQESVVKTTSDMFSKFKMYAKDFDKNSIKMGISSFDTNLRIMTQNLYGIVAPPGIGKTSILLQFFENASNDGVPCIFFSFDMGSDDLCVKIISRHTGESEETICRNIQEGSEKKVLQYEQIMNTKYANVEFVFKQLNGDEMIATTLEREKANNVTYKMFGIDYLTKMKTLQTEISNKTEEAINCCHYFAKEYNKAGIVLIQPNKANTHPNKPMEDYNGIKGSSAIAEACTAILAAYREGYDPRSYDSDKYLTLCCVKNRKGRLFVVDFKWDGRLGLISEMDKTSTADLAQYRQARRDAAEEDRAERRSGSW